MKYLIIALLIPQLSFAKENLLNTLVRSVTAQAVEAPKDNEVCFAPEGECDQKLVKFIQSAQTSLDVAIFDLNLDQVVHEIAKAKIQKKKVRVIVDNRQSKAHHSLVTTLHKAGVEVRVGRQRGIFHNKFTIVDGKRLQTGSFNYTNGAAFKNAENQIYLGNSEIVVQYTKQFNIYWGKAKPFKPK